MKEDGQCKKAVNVTVPILKEWVIASYEKLRRGGQASGVDGESWEEFDKNLERNLHVLWSRLASGSYHPQAVKAVEIPKLDGTKRKLGIPTVRDRICQGVSDAIRGTNRQDISSKLVWLSTNEKCASGGC